MTDGSGPGADGIWQKLRRRKVVQWGIAYAVGAWGFLQGLEYVSESFGWPGELRQVAILALLIGLPIVLVVAWYHGDRGEQRVSGAEFAILTVLFLLGGGIFWRYEQAAEQRRDAARASQESPGAAAPTPDAQKVSSIAVLPFVNMSADAENEFFSAGISEELLNVLVRVDGLGVASRTSSFAYKGSKLGAAAIARELKVDHILEGSVRKAGQHVRVTAQLIDAKNDRHLWSETYERELTDIFAIQDEIANAIVSALRGTIGTANAASTVTVRADTGNLEAYEIYLKARELFIARRNLPESVHLFERVVELDPKFARGWEGLAAVACVMTSWGFRERDYDALTRKAAKRALELDGSLSMPWAALGQVEQSMLPVDWQRSLDLLDRAVAADAHNATALLWRSIAWISLGFLDRALADQDRCLEIDPAYQNCKRYKALTLLYSGDTKLALELFEQGVAAGFTYNVADNFVVPLLKRGDRVGALLVMKELGITPEFGALLFAALERSDAPPPVPDEVVRRHLDAAGPEFAARMGPEKARVWLGKYDEATTSPSLDSNFYSQWDPNLVGFHNSPARKRMLERLGIPAYWREHGYPPQCRPVDQHDFSCD